MHDAVIVGGGPAGASCALWLARLGLSPILVEAGARLGGLAQDNPFADDWIAVLPGVTGQQVAANIDTSVRAANVPLRMNSRVVDVLPCKGGVQATLAGPDGGQEQVRGRTLVI
ncbi:MAG TPA: NAD(P)/FAD-dependent oxidoreductase, partial [Achromobacter sp.]|nr:NAD(P)/FAD-dependent oxidoreductase [Achromobacter sp.]